MLELLEETSQLAAASFLRPPATTEPDDPVLAWREALRGLVQPEQPHLFKAVAFAQLQGATDACFPPQPGFAPRLQCFRDVLWKRGGGALYDGESGLALPGTFLARMPRQRQTPTCSCHRQELTRPLQSMPRLERAVVLPFALCSNFGHFITETLAFLWPLFADIGSTADTLLDLTGWPVLLGACPPGDPAARVLHALLRERHAFPLLEVDLPEQLHLQEAWVPQPSLRLHAFCSDTYLRTASAVGDWLLQHQADGADPLPGGDKLFISRSALGPEARSVDQEAALEALLEQQGWTLFHPEQHTLAQQVAVYRRAKVVAAFEGSALHGLSVLGLAHQPPAVVMLGDTPSPDYFLQFRAQRIAGFFIQCTRPDPASDRPPWTQPRLLNGSVDALAAMVEALAAGC
jgi:hypothetical protein